MSRRYLGSFVTYNPVQPTTSAASGMWPLNQQYQNAGNWPLPFGDPYFNYNTLLLSSTSLGNANNNLFVDSSGAFNPISRNGNTAQGSATPYSASWSNYFDGSGDFLSAPSNAAFDLSSSSFTVECWFNANSFAANFGLISRYNFTSVGLGWGLIIMSSTVVRFVRGNDIVLDCTVSAMSTGVWYHVAAVRNGSTLTVYLNGVQVGQATGISNFTDAATALQIGRTNTVTNDINGYISNARVVKGTAVYTSAFTPPTAPLTAITNTSLLTCQSNRFRDASSNNFTITRSGDTRVTNFAPFLRTAPIQYNQSDITNWSGYFDGSGDYLQMPSNAAFAFGTGDYTIEGWIYVTVGGLDQRVTWFSDDRHNIDINTSNQIFLYDGAIRTFGTVAVGTWNHFAVSRTGGTVSCYLNGVRGYNASETTNTSTRSMNIAANNAGNGYFNGYISNIRVVKGTGVYSGATITVPTTSLTAISGTSLLTLQNAAFTDNSTNNFVITPNGNVTVTGNSPFNPVGYWSNYFDGTGDYLNTAASSSLGLTGDWTVEGWVYQTSTAGTQIFLETRGSSTTGFGIYCSLTGYAGGPGAFGYATNSALVATSSTVIPLNKWTHLAVTRSSNTVKGYINGVSAFTYTESRTLSSTMTYIIGADYLAGSNAYGYFSNLRVVRGTVVYTGNFTPPTTPLTAITNTSLLTCQNGRFIDNSTNAFAITLNGNTSVQSFDPFYTSTIASNGGSIALDGTGDYLNLSAPPLLAFGASSFTIEGWVYPRTNTDILLVDFRPASVNGAYPCIYLNSSGYLTYYVSTADRISGSTIVPLNAWSHFAVCRSGTSTTLYLNGVQQGATYSDSNSYLVGAGRPIIGASGFGSGSNAVNGYMADVRVTNGTAIYTAAFTPPTAPLTPSANTGLLVNGMNAGAYDATAINDMETVGNAQVTTAVSKFGGSSMYFDGTGDYLVAPDSANLELGSGDFTIEAWVYLPSLPASGGIYAIVSKWASTQYSYLTQIRNNAGTMQLGFAYSPNASSVTTVYANASITAATWHHCAWVRNGTSFKMFLNGTEVTSGVTISGSIADTAVALNVGRNNDNIEYLTGYIDDLRITKGVARYTSNFTPPTAALPTY